MQTLEPGKTYYKWFTTRTVAGVPATLAGTPSLKGYNQTATTTDFTTGITLTADYDSITGQNMITLDTSDATAYPVGEDFAIKIFAGTVNSVSVVGEVVWEFNTRIRAQGKVQSGTLSAGGSTTAFTLPSGRRTGVTVGMVLDVEGIGARYIATYNSSTGAGTVTDAYASDTSSTFFRVWVAAPADTGAPVPANATQVKGYTISGNGTTTPFYV